MSKLYHEMSKGYTPAYPSRNPSKLLYDFFTQVLSSLYSAKIWIKVDKKLRAEDEMNLGEPKSSKHKCPICQRKVLWNSKAVECKKHEKKTLNVKK